MTTSLVLWQSDFPWLSLLLLLLPLGALITLIMPVREARWTSLTTALAALVISLLVAIGFDKEQVGFQFLEQSEWITSLNIHYLLGVDGLSILFLPFTALLFIAAILASWNAIRFLPNFFFALLLVLEMALMGIFTALDTILFFLFWEFSLLPLFFLVSLWGAGPNRRHAAVKYTLFMLTGGVFILIGFVVLALQDPSGLNFTYPALLHIAHTHPLQTAIFFLLVLGFAFKVPVVPFHSWLPVLAQEGPAGVIALIVGLKVGVYGIIRFALPLAPAAAQEYQWLLVGSGMLSVLYGALAALSQTNLRRLLAFASLSHVGMVMMGVASLNQAGLQGALFQLINFTLIASSLFFIVGFIHQRIGSSDFLNLGGLASSMPLLSAFYFFFGMASLGLPGTSGFPAEFLLITGVLEQNLGSGILALVSIIISAAYFLISFRLAFLGKTKHAVVLEAPDLKRRELGVLLLLASLVLLLGFYPQALLTVIENSSLDWLGRMTLLVE